MSAKPSEQPEWASAPPGGAIVEPLAGKKAAGWAEAEKPPSEYLNWLFNTIYQWTTYVGDGDLEVDGLVLGTKLISTLTNATINDLDLGDGLGHYAGTMVALLVSGGSSTVITGIANADQVEGRTILVVNNSGQTIHFTIQDTGSTASSRIQANWLPNGTSIEWPNGGALLLRYTDPGPGRWAIVSASWPIDYTLRTTDVSAIAARETGGANHTLGAGSWTTGASTDPILYPLAVDVGRVIDGWSLYVQKNSNAASTLLAQLVKIDSTGTVSGVGAQQSNSANAPGNVVMTVASGLAETVVAGVSYWIKFTPNNGTAGDKTFTGSVTSRGR